jgi:hypothetical protein
MSIPLLLAAINEMSVEGKDEDALRLLEQSLDTIISNDNFPGNIQEASFCKLTEVKDALEEMTKGLVDEHDDLAAALEAAAKFDVPAGNTETEHLIRLMIRAEEDGSLSFEFRNLRWNWDHNLGAWKTEPTKK